MNTSRKVMLIGLFMVVFGMAWMLVNSLTNVYQAQSEIDEANRELEESNHAVDAALTDCLKFSTYYDCQNVVMNNCLEDGKGYNECLVQWNEMYGRVIDA